MNQIDMAVVPEKECKIVSEASIARKLLKDGYRVVDIKPKRGRNRETIFVFKNENGFMDKLGEYIQERKDQRDMKEEE